MKRFSEIVRGRSTPGILIFNRKDQLLYFNQEALEMVPKLQMVGKGGKPSIPREISRLCRELKAPRQGKGKDLATEVRSGILDRKNDSPFSLRAFFIGREQGQDPTHIMVLIEKITESHSVNFEKVKRQFELSRRELEVLRLLCQGLGNKQISERLFISQYTAKDHVKKIMKKLGVNSRSQIISSLNR
ncbi:MAG: LuxR C-terminal-related transcriptional regulator [candidate division NC10 bacterium]|nr:LuxR C-terminal-related transcriptional regulator [candidate division NC10 bacterium]